MRVTNGGLEHVASVHVLGPPATGELAMRRYKIRVMQGKQHLLTTEWLNTGDAQVLVSALDKQYQLSITYEVEMKDQVHRYMPADEFARDMGRSFIRSMGARQA